MAELMVIVAAVLWGIIGIFLNTLTGMGFTRPDIILSRTLMTTLFGFIYLLIKNKKAIRIAVKDLWIFFGVGVVSFICMNLCYLNCITEAGLSVAAILLYTAPIWVMLFSILLFKERFTKAKGIALVLAFAGCVLVTGIFSGGSGRVTPLGLLLGLGSGLSYALYTVFSSLGLRKYDAITVTAWGFLFGTIGILPMLNLKQLMATSVANPKGALLLIACGICTSVIPYVLYTKALTKMDGSRAAIIACVEPAVATVSGVIFYDERLTLWSVMGIGCVIAAVVLLELGATDSSAKDRSPEALAQSPETKDQRQE